MRALQVLVVVMGILILAGVAVVVGTIIHRATQPPQEAEKPKGLPTFGDVDLTLPDGARVVWMTVEGDRLVIHIQGAGEAARFEVVDLITGNRLGAVHVGAGTAR